MSFRSVFISVFLGAALVVAALIINRERPSRETAQSSAALVRATGKCAECHRVHRQRPPGQPPLQRLALVTRHDDEQASVVGLIDLVDGADVGVVQGRCGLRLGDEAKLGGGVGEEAWRQELERDHPAEASVLGTVYHSHAAGAEFGDDAKMRDGLADHEVPVVRQRIERIPGL